jgi:uncharacterized membrane protein YphA (DoxX/SURF4 family)
MKAMDGTLLVGRILMAASFVPAAYAHFTNISGFAAALAAKGLPSANGLSALIVLFELFGPLALAAGVAPRIAAAGLAATTLVTTGLLHRFWEFGGVARQVEETLFVANLGIFAGLLFFIAAGPGALSWQGWWRGMGEKRKPAGKKKAAKPRAPRPKPAPARDLDEELADAA